MKDKVYLFGPFFGEVSWEYFQFAPYAIHLKKNETRSKLVVCTRPERFDLYGQYADILVPMRLKSDRFLKQNAFRLEGGDPVLYTKMAYIFFAKYKKLFGGQVEHYIPDISSLRYNLKWQFPRGKMDYNFIPRLLNHQYIHRVMNTENVVIVDKEYQCNDSKYNIITIDELVKTVNKVIDNNKISYLGCLIEILKCAKFTISDLKSDVGRLSILLKIPLIYPNRQLSNDRVNLLNPLKTKIIDCETVEEGIDIYENNI